MFLEPVKGLVAIEGPDGLIGKDLSGVVADAAAGGIGCELLDLIPFLLGQADVEAAKPGGR